MQATLRNTLSKEFEQNGFVVVKRVYSERELESLRNETDALIGMAERNNSDLFTNYYMKHRPDNGVLYDLYQRDPLFAQAIRNEHVMEAVREIYSPNFYLYENSLVYKPKGKRNAVPWHQDFINRPNEPIKVIAWIALDNVTEANGSMYAIPGSHNLGFLPYFTVPGEAHHTRAQIENVDESKAVPLEMEAGDVLLFHQLLLHSSKEVHVTEPRRAYRVSLQKFDVSFTPRGNPIVLSLGDLSALEKRYVYDAPQPKPNPLRRAIRKVGRGLAKI